MQFPLKGQQHHQNGWTANSDIPRTVERKRKGRGVDIISSSLPTPPSHTHLPTPETIRRSGRPRKPAAVDSAVSSVHLPTPQTQRTKRRLSPPRSTIEEEPIPSPSGHTTFFLANHASSSTRPEKIRRRPGLTFAQQMGLLTNSKNGVGVGMGGHKSANHGKVDQIGSTTHVSLPTKDDNPFLVSGLGAPVPLASPGHITIHRPGEDDFDSETEGIQPLVPSPLPRRGPRLASPSPSTSLAKMSTSIKSPSGLLSPPPTKHAARIGLFQASSSSSKPKAMTREQMARRKKEEEMLDYEDNPFLVKRGECSTRAPQSRGPIVDEDLPTVTYVFRGSKKVFANPLFPSNAPFPRAELHPDDDEFEPHPLPKPKLLWPTGPSPSKSKIRELVRTPSPDREGISPPSSPVSTPTTSRRFGHTALARTPHGSKERVAEEGIYSDDEGEVMMRNIRGHGVEENHDEELPSRRGLLFGAGARAGVGLNMGSKGTKRALGGIGGEDADSRGKKPRGIFRL
ncbi:uncharacterized protein I303_108551 [Kwoniella dejecticola CBS 10117]|uniref:Uncharacterized protein n=1 Tax=Kwoniella dejecticola CBS 10117 TaxID=1296121 RepID=A0A1A5ZX31_9TREE|nr:uncharacterized protein I303_07124 [Kwoniella dejecticola CBS 10117]OBR82365.1 hypothetical protein I303_07124 [Kwoniella dejecticola CBS 10117]